MLPVDLPCDWCLYLLPPKSHCIFPNLRILYQVVSRYLKLWSQCQTHIIVLHCFESKGVEWFHASFPQGYPGGLVSKESACSAGDPDSVPELRRSPGEGNGYPLQYSCLEKHRQRSLAGYSPWGHKQLDMTERLTFHSCHQRDENTGAESKKTTRIWYDRVPREK